MRWLAEIDEVQAFLRDYVARDQRVDLLIVARDWRAQQAILDQLGKPPKTRYGSTAVIGSVRVKVARSLVTDCALAGYAFDAALVHVEARPGLVTEVAKRMVPHAPVRLFGGAP